MHRRHKQLKDVPMRDLKVRALGKIERRNIILLMATEHAKMAGNPRIRCFRDPPARARPAHAQRAYAGDVARFCADARKPLPAAR